MINNVKMLIIRRQATGIAVGALRHISSNLSSDSSNGIKVDLDSHTGIAVVKWNQKPVNALGLKFIQDNLETLKSLQANQSCRGVILTSEIPNIFCAGLNLKEVLEGDRDYFVKHRNIFYDLMEAYRFGHIPVVSAINGHAPAGGCVIAMATDYRIMKSGVGTIGLNESKLGLRLPKWLVVAYAELLGSRRAELAVLLGTRFNADEALKIGLVDELAVDDDDLMRRANEIILKLTSVPSDVYRSFKLDFGRHVLDAFKEDRENLHNYVDSFLSGRNSVRRYYDNLKKQ